MNEAIGAIQSFKVDRIHAQPAQQFPNGKVDASAFKQSMHQHDLKTHHASSNVFDMISKTHSERGWNTWTGHQYKLDMFRRNQLKLREKILTNLQLRSQMDPGTTQYMTEKMAVIQEKIDRLRFEADKRLGLVTETVEGVQPGQLLKPAESFFNFVSRGEKQLLSLEAEIDRVFSLGQKSIDPAVLLRFQLRMSHVMQQLELFTSTLNKGLESFKNVSNTQI